MCPIFKNIEISRKDIEEYMKQFAEDNDMMKQPSRSLIGNMYGEKILLATPLLKWYLEHGLEVTQVYQVVEFTPEPCFSSFGVAVSNAHRAGDVDPSKAIANTMKLYAKLRMLEFYYDFIDKFVDRSDFQYLEMDTDSAYIGISGESLEEVIRPELREQFQEEKHLWLPRNDTPEKPRLR
ncbi:hypothetical protein QZH41_009984 [Actinostola sp. cb2023]|nr:hypothetical protein QZH41_009984 [Actinostola sp. cb2023]